jgi:hypothetical protein
MHKDAMSGDNESSDASQLDPEQIEAELIDLARQTGQAVEDFVVERPHAALALAAGVGFIIGGGLTPKRLLKWGFLLAGPALTRGITDRVAATVEEALGADSFGATGHGGKRSDPKKAEGKRGGSRSSS